MNKNWSRWRQMLLSMEGNKRKVRRYKGKEEEWKIENGKDVCTKKRRETKKEKVNMNCCCYLDLNCSSFNFFLCCKCLLVILYLDQEWKGIWRNKRWNKTHLDDGKKERTWRERETRNKLRFSISSFCSSFCLNFVPNLIQIKGQTPPAYDTFDTFDYITWHGRDLKKEMEGITTKICGGKGSHIQLMQWETAAKFEGHIFPFPSHELSWHGINQRE